MTEKQNSNIPIDIKDDLNSKPMHPAKLLQAKLRSTYLQIEQYKQKSNLNQDSNIPSKLNSNTNLREKSNIENYDRGEKLHERQRGSDQNSFTSPGIDSNISRFVEWYEANKILLQIEERDDLNRLFYSIEERELLFLEEIHKFVEKNKKMKPK